MLWLAGYKRNGLPDGLIRLHEFLLRDVIDYFEKGKVARKKMKHARKAVKQALKMANGNKAKAAKLLGIHRTGLYQRLLRLNLGGEFCKSIAQ